jgi:hypothetical protein
MEDGEIVPYLVRLDNAQQVAPDDDDDMIRLAARACSDPTIMLAFAVPQARQKTKLRFVEGDRAVVQLNAGVWETGSIVEVWARPLGTKPQAWSRVAVPYAVKLDTGDRVLVPYDSDEVIRIEDVMAQPKPKPKSQPQKRKMQFEGGWGVGNPWAKKMKTALGKPDVPECENCDCGADHGHGGHGHVIAHGHASEHGHAGAHGHDGGSWDGHGVGHGSYHGSNQGAGHL